ncbi:3-carboxymuconate cyclase [Beggiatoa alba B18LD]|uniref:3-carboxymuconate cyclase n=1 Tax=Beggiatoa alba B18LD TaxID=395493 RepID=I3CC47_9GAMM|nr:beta-propeller fold lactonase family protein [Beggiatoa alba]EIJ41190.1 3-carboxymuconate cyclase [Beggiatoa alba B18LD]
MMNIYLPLTRNIVYGCCLLVMFGFMGFGTQSAAEKLHITGVVDSNSDIFLNSPWAVAVSPDNKQVVVASLADDALLLFERNLNTGKLSLLASYFNNDSIQNISGLSAIQAVVFSPDGLNLYVAADNAVVVFSRDVETGLLTFVEVQQSGRLLTFGTLTSLVASPDGQFVYVVSQSESILFVFKRDLSSGHLTLLEMQQDGVNGVSGLTGANTVITTTDGQYVYVSGQNSHSIVVFRRLSAGNLAYLQTVSSDIDNVTGLEGVSALLLSRDNRFLYALGLSSDKLVIFSRNTDTGFLSFVEAVGNENTETAFLDQPMTLAVSDDDRTLYIASLGGKVASLSRNLLTGKVLLDEVFTSSDTVLTEARAMSISPDGHSLYVASSKDNALVIFSIANYPTDFLGLGLGFNIDKDGQIIGSFRSQASFFGNLFVGNLLQNTIGLGEKTQLSISIRNPEQIGSSVNIYITAKLRKTLLRADDDAGDWMLVPTGSEPESWEWQPWDGNPDTLQPTQTDVTLEEENNAQYDTSFPAEGSWEINTSYGDLPPDDTGYTVSSEQNTSATVTNVPLLGGAVAYDGANNSISSVSTFYGGIAVNQGTFLPVQSVVLAQSVVVKGRVTVEPAHRTQVAEILVFAYYSPPNITEIAPFMMDGYNPALWNNQLSALTSLTSDVLSGDYYVTMYSGNFVATGRLIVRFGYRLADHTVVYSANPIDITIR